MNLVFLGAPGAGKGTIAKELINKHDFLSISTGDLVRAEIKQETELGKEIKQIVESGSLVDDKLITKLLEKKILESKRKEKIIFDGFPRNMKQAVALEELLEKLGLKLECAIYLEVSKETVVKRLSSRRINPSNGEVYNLLFNPPKDDSIKLVQRKDDKPEVIEKRFVVFENETKPLLTYYKEKNLLKKSSAEGTIEENLSSLEKVLGL